MKVTINELRNMIREALEEKLTEETGDTISDQPEETLPETKNSEEVATEGWDELEEAWHELEEASSLQEAAAKKEEPKAKKKPAEKEERKEKKEEGGMKITKAQLMKALDLNPAQEMDFKRAIDKGHSVADALAAATKKKA